jgi:CRP/FNR family transcriptional regulator, cyclic AMP receptor protein
MIERFQGEDCKPTLLKALKCQFCIRDNNDLALALSELVTLNEYPAGFQIIKQDSDDNKIHFILSGQVDVQVNNRHIAYREAGTHIGEMAMIDPSTRRSASIIVTEAAVTASLSCTTFHDLAEKFPQLWRYLALELGNRLRQRNAFVRIPNPISELFLGSSRESMRVVDAIVNSIDRSRVKPTPWYTEDIFRPSNTAIEDLEIQLARADFAAFVFGPDDVIISRDEYYDGPRDNVIIEFGLFSGAIGRKRTYILKPQDMSIKIPSDLLGIKPIQYKYDKTTNLIDISNAVTELMSRIIDLGVR